MAQHLLNVSPAIIADQSLQETFGFKSVHTSKNYVGCLKQAYLLVGLHKYSQKSRQRMMGEKVYPIDVALMNKRADAFAKENLGWRLETIVYIELLRKCKTFIIITTGQENVILWSATAAVRCLQYRCHTTFQRRRRASVK